MADDWFQIRVSSDLENRAEGQLSSVRLFIFSKSAVPGMGVSRKSESKNRFVSSDSKCGAIEEVTEPACTNYDRGHEHQESGNDGRYVLTACMRLPKKVHNLRGDLYIFVSHGLQVEHST